MIQSIFGHFFCSQSFKGSLCRQKVPLLSFMNTFRIIKKKIMHTMNTMNPLTDAVSSTNTKMDKNGRKAQCLFFYFLYSEGPQKVSTKSFNKKCPQKVSTKLSTTSERMCFDCFFVWLCY